MTYRKPTASGRAPRALAMAMATAAGAFMFTFSTTAAQAQSVDLDAIFWCDEAVGPMGDQTEEQCLESRQVLLTNCTSCHSFAPVVLRQRSKDEWAAFLNVHRQRVPQVSDADYEELKEFIGTRFTPDHPVPDLPPALQNYTLPEA